jgi:hypothetical protein
MKRENPIEFILPLVRFVVNLRSPLEPPFRIAQVWPKVAEKWRQKTQPGGPAKVAEVAEDTDLADGEWDR